MQLIILVEASSKSKSDYMYIREFINKHYCCTRIKALYMNGKGNYASLSIKKQIEKIKKEYSLLLHDKTEVLLCIDTDNLNNIGDLNKTKKIQEYCVNNKYQFVFFSYDIEEVFLNKKVSNKDKIKEAESFIRFNKINNINISRFNSNNIKKGYSNLNIVLSSLLKKKN